MCFFIFFFSFIKVFFHMKNIKKLYLPPFVLSKSVSISVRNKLYKIFIVCNIFPSEIRGLIIFSVPITLQSSSENLFILIAEHYRNIARKLPKLQKNSLKKNLNNLSSSIRLVHKICITFYGDFFFANKIIF